MFYLGSIAGILPYILAFSLTLILGGHAGLPFFTSKSTPEIKNEMQEEGNHPVEDLKSFAFDMQSVAKKITVFLIPFDISATVLNLYLFRFVDSTKPGISLLRAPPVSLF